MSTARPVVVLPGRFSASASALRYRAVVNARALLEAAFAAGGEPVTMLPGPAAEVAGRLRWADAVLLPGGGDVSPARYGQPVQVEQVADVDDLQDEFDLAVARWALETGVPLLAVCRGMQVVNVALGGTLQQHLAQPHLHLDHEVRVVPGTRAADVLGERVHVSCYHHQGLDRVAADLRPAARGAGGSVEAVVAPAAPGWFLGVQWHPEDTAAHDPQNAALFDALVGAARRRAAP